MFRKAKNYLLIQGGIEVRIGSYNDGGSQAIIYTISDYLSSSTISLKDNGALLDKEEYYPALRNVSVAHS